MKHICLVFAVILASLASSAQTHRVTLVCMIDPAGRIEYFSLPKMLPDSIVSKVLIDPRKMYKVKDNYKTLMIMQQNGWKLVNVQTYAPSVVLYYHLTRDIELDDEAYKLFMSKAETNK